MLRESYVASRPTPRLYMTSLEAQIIQIKSQSQEKMTGSLQPYNRNPSVEPSTGSALLADQSQASQDQSQVALPTHTNNSEILPLPVVKTDSNQPTLQIPSSSGTKLSSPTDYLQEITTQVGLSIADPTQTGTLEPPDSSLRLQSLGGTEYLDKKDNIYSASKPSRKNKHSERVFSPEYCKCGSETQSDLCAFANKVFDHLVRDIDDEDDLKTAYSVACRRKVSAEQERLILVDVLRTYAELKVYQDPESTSTKSLCNILRALASHWSGLGYVQGMNFIVASLKYHLQEEYLTFWASVYLFNLLDLHKNFSPGKLLIADIRFARTAPPLIEVRVAAQEKTP